MSQAQQEYLRRQLVASESTAAQLRRELEAAESALQAAEEAYKRETHIVGVTSGFRELDTMLGGLHRSDLLILAGRPSMGKTALATNIAFNAAKAFREIVEILETSVDLQEISAFLVIL